MSKSRAPRSGAPAEQPAEQPAEAPVASGERVRRAAVTLFAERGFHGTGIRDLARAAGLSSATLYHYMGTKQDLLAEVMRVSLTRLIEAAEASLAAYDDPLDRLRALVETHVREHADQRDQTLVVDNDLHVLDEQRRREILALRDRYEALFSTEIEAARRRGDLAVEDTALARLALLDMCSGVSRWYRPDGRLSLDEVATAYGVHALRLLGATPDQSGYFGRGGR